ncbi:CvpA family protein [Rhodanobacter glycinis]|uniref:CvpA family protein n=1 Tax=Rhodanobacter glycinis TaxID=582702 RepID=A0A502FN35_9GAMM|nr:CvpA family protein [Rhodanobacter glycinis]TPG10150.1 CvpA family protein [Rhodanobacter glycinis]TPG50938.1 CvpA family protein [Rhodanobacter glycinis]
MNGTDWVILAILGLSILIGLWRGLVAELLSLVIWVAAFWVAAAFGPAVAAQLEHVISVPIARIGLGYALCFIAVLIVGALLRFATRRLIWSTGLSGIDRLFGMLFGFVRGALLVTLLVFLVGLTMFTREPWWQQSVLLPQFQGLAAWLGQNIPANVRDHLHPADVLDKIHPSAVLDHLPSLSGTLAAPMSGATSAPAAPRTTSAPATASSAASRPRHP